MPPKPPTADQPKRKPGRPRKEPFVGKTAFIAGEEIARELNISTATLYRWVADESFPEQRCRPGACTRLWLRAHWDEFVATGKWPKEAWKPMTAHLVSFRCREPFPIGAAPLLVWEPD